MIPGPFAICHVTTHDDSDALTYTTLRYGYDSAEQAFKDIGAVAAEKSVDPEECAVILHVDQQ